MVSHDGERDARDDREGGKARVEVDDSNVPVGNAPVAKRWPLYTMVVVWLGWIGFLVAIGLLSHRSPMS